MKESLIGEKYLVKQLKNILPSEENGEMMVKSFLKNSQQLKIDSVSRRIAKWERNFKVAYSRQDTTMLGPGEDERENEKWPNSWQ